MFTSGVGLRKIGGIAVLFENHVACLVSNSCIWMCCGVVEELENFRSSFVSGFGFLQGDGAEGYVHDWINGSSVAK